MGFSDFDIMSRCKKIFDHLVDVTDVAINSAKSVIDTVNTNVNSVKSYTTTNNTASETGVLSQKLSWLITVNKNHGSLEKTSAGNRDWTCPTGVYYVYVIACGGQGGGGGGGGGYYGSVYTNYYYRKAGGGGSGAVSEIVSALIPVTPGTVYALTVGAGGSAGAAGKKGANTMTAGGAGGNGGDTKFGSIFTVIGGGGGSGGAAGKILSDSMPAANAAAGGSVRTSIGSTLRQILLNIVASVAGKAGVAPPAVNSTFVNVGSKDSEGTAGGAKVTNRLGLSSGAGGAGGRNGYPGTSSNSSENGSDGSAGSAGAAGYIKVIW